MFSQELCSYQLLLWGLDLLIVLKCEAVINDDDPCNHLSFIPSVFHGFTLNDIVCLENTNVKNMFTVMCLKFRTDFTRNHREVEIRIS